MKVYLCVDTHDGNDPIEAEVTPGCEWVLAGEGVATRKYDGTCCMFDGEQWWARREVKPGKLPPRNFDQVSHDDITGKTVGWAPIGQSGFEKWHAEALANSSHDFAEGTYELCGPKVNGNPEKFARHHLIAHATAMVMHGLGTTYEELRESVGGFVAAEGVVWHHHDGRMAKLKARDFS